MLGVPVECRSKRRFASGRKRAWTWTSSRDPWSVQLRMTRVRAHRAPACGTRSRRSAIPVTHPEAYCDAQCLIASAMHRESASQGLDQMLQNFGFAFYFFNKP